MATVAESLFGVTPESLQRQRQQQLRQEAMDYASIADPFQQANFAIYQGAGNLARGIGGLLGAQDPELMRVRQRQELLQGVDITDPEALREAASKFLQSGDPTAAQDLARRAMDIEKTQAQITKDTAAADASTAAANRDRTPQTPADILKAQRIAAIQQALPVYAAQGDKDTVRLLTNELNALLPADKLPSFGAEAERVSRELYNKPFSDLTQPEIAAVNKRVDESAKSKAPKVEVNLPGVKQAGDVTGLRKDLQSITKPYQDQADAAGDAIDLANMAIKTNNFAAVSTLSRSLAKASGETQLSSRDVEAFNIDPSLVGRVSDTVSRLAQGRPTVDTLTKLRQLAEALKKKSEARIALEEQQLQDTARVSGLFTEQQINTVFRRRPAQGAGGTPKTSFNSIKEAEAANLPKGTVITINGRRAIVE